MLVPEQAAAKFLQEAKDARDLSVEDLRDVFSVSYEMAAHRFTNLATHHLDIPCHFVKNDESGIIYKAYENDGVVFPADPTGAIEGQRMCRQWSGRQVFHAPDKFSPYFQYSDTPSGTYWCTAFIDSGRERGFAITLGAPYDHSRWFRGRDTTLRTTSRVPGRGVLPAPADRARRAVGWHGLAVCPRALAHPAGPAIGQLSWCRRGGCVRVPGPSGVRVAELRWRAVLAEAGSPLFAQRSQALLNVVAEERQHLVGRRLVKDGPGVANPAIERALGQPDCLLRPRR